MTGYYTVVYRVDGDGAAHDAWWQGVRPLFMADAGPISVVSITQADEALRLDKIREVVERRDTTNIEKVDAIRELLDLVQVPAA
jgi:hypothetical protein